MKTCPFCGAEQIGHAYNGTIFNYGCKTWAPSKDPEDRTRECYERQLSQQAELIGRALEVVRSVVKARESVCMMGPLAFVLTYREAQALLPALEKALEKTP
jgi:hypothetical protein